MPKAGDVCPRCGKGTLSLVDEQGIDRTLKCSVCPLHFAPETTIEEIDKSFEESRTHWRRILEEHKLIHPHFIDHLEEIFKKELELGEAKLKVAQKEGSSFLIMDCETTIRGAKIALEEIALSRSTV